MGFFIAVRTCLRKYFTLSGRAPRSEFWWFMLFLMLLGIVGLGVDYLIIGPGALDEDTNGPASIFINLATIVPSVTVTVRRLHDTGKPGYFFFFPVLVIIGVVLIAGLLVGEGGGPGGLVLGLGVIVGLLLYLYWLVKRSDPGANAYGPNPLTENQQVEEVFE